ncbi:MAG: HAD-IC family P-type ATPase [Candidatus Magasanikbacteria bacterium]|nr:HAD-IC family P-type ATPase [Candidatus Magasanikbacteria bacterium]
MSTLQYTTQNIVDIFSALKTDKNGLSDGEALKRQQQYGLNQLGAREVKWWQIFLRQFISPFIYILLFAAALAIFMSEMIDGLLIIAFILINTTLGFAQEFHSERALILLRQFVVSRARVRRDGKEKLIDSKELVPGDIALVETGDIIPADLRFLETNDLTVDESILTGESVPVAKIADKLSAEQNEIYEALNLGFSGARVVTGRGIGIVINIGRDTVMGDVAKRTVETKRESSFEKGIAKFSKFILRMILLILILLFVANLLIKGHNANIAELLLFSIALAVSVIPEALPLVTTLSLSRGALQMARQHVVVKRLSAVEDLGSVEILCADKTGTITENKLTVAEIKSDNPTDCLFYAMAAASFLGEGKPEPNNAFDLALWNRLDKKEKVKVKQIKRLTEIPFDPERRRNSVLIKTDAGCQMIIRGAAEIILNLSKNITDKTALQKWLIGEGKRGRRVIAIAAREYPVLNNYTEAEEKNLELIGLISFVDPIKSTTKSAITHAEHLGVRIKILTGDSREVAGAVAKEVNIIKSESEVITGEELMALGEEEQHLAAQKYNVFARVSPEQKYRVIELLQNKYEVGFLGEGINDAPALKKANVGLVVNGAADIAREAADIVLLNPSLSTIIDGIRDGRSVFANTVKYLKITLISNFGNFYAIATASLMISFLPMLPVQILLLNLLSDFPMIAIALDSVDKAELRRPRAYNVHEVVMIAIFLGLVSTVFDFIFFALFFRREPVILQTSWFIGSVLTEIVLIYSARTRFLFLKTKAPSLVLGSLSILAILATVLIPFTAFGNAIFHFAKPTSANLIIIFSVVAGYFIVTEMIKLVYYKMGANRQNVN